MQHAVVSPGIKHGVSAGLGIVNKRTITAYVGQCTVTIILTAHIDRSGINDVAQKVGSVSKNAARTLFMTLIAAQPINTQSPIAIAVA